MSVQRLLDEAVRSSGMASPRWIVLYNTRYTQLVLTADKDGNPGNLLSVDLLLNPGQAGEYDKETLEGMSGIAGFGAKEQADTWVDYATAPGMFGSLVVVPADTIQTDSVPIVPVRYAPDPKLSWSGDTGAVDEAVVRAGKSPRWTVHYYDPNARLMPKSQVLTVSADGQTRGYSGVETVKMFKDSAWAFNGALAFIVGTFDSKVAADQWIAAEPKRHGTYSAATLESLGITADVPQAPADAARSGMTI